MNTKLNINKLLPGSVNANPLFTAPPAGQPFNEAPWNYNGTETTTSYATTVTDWVLLSFRTDNLSAASTVKKMAGFLLSNGSIELLPNVCLDLSPNTGYYIIVEHRNHVAVMSPTPISIVNNVLTFDFTNQDSYTPANAPAFGQKKLSNNKWVMMAGDGRKTPNSQNNELNSNDSLEWRTNSGFFGKYLRSDYNMDGDVNATDINFWRSNNGKYSGIPK
jgi:hypothetical protein